MHVTATDGDGEMALECLVEESNLSNQVAWEWNGSHRGYNYNNRLRFLDNAPYLLIRE